MNAWQWLEIADTAYTVGQLALCVGCPVAGVTLVATKFLVKELAKKTAKQIMLSAAAGVTATVAAAMMTGGDGAGAGGGNPNLAAEDLKKETVTLVVQLDPTGQPEIAEDGKPIERDDLLGYLNTLTTEGSLRRVICHFKVPETEWLNWKLKLLQIQTRLEQEHPDLEFTIHTTN